MQVNGPFGSAGRGGIGRVAALAQRVEKASASSQLGARSHDSARKQDKQPPRLQVELVCQDETVRHDPFWDAPRLKPTFVAQLMGQVMPGNRIRAVPANAYSKAAARTALLVDRKD